MRPMETLFAIGMMVGLMKPHADPPKPMPFEQVNVERPQSEQRHAAAGKTQSQKKSDWPLDY
jgi:hypothetical protein